MEDDTQRFDIEHIEFDKDGIPVIPRISFSVPKSFRQDFLQRMIDEVRSTPGEQLMAIFVQGMRIYRAEVTAQATLPPEGERRRLPHYGPKSSTSKVAQGEAQNAGE
jgi:hypothetical protein